MSAMDASQALEIMQAANARKAVEQNEAYGKWIQSSEREREQLNQMIRKVASDGQGCALVPYESDTVARGCRCHVERWLKDLGYRVSYCSSGLMIHWEPQKEISL